MKKPASLNRRRKALRGLGKFVIYFILSIVSFMFLTPIFTIVSKSFMSVQDVVDPAVQ